MLTLLALAALGLALLTVAADHLVLGAGRLAARFGISPVVVGVVVIGLGTSAPELVVSGIASVRGDGGLAVANLVGSNVLNVTVILGIAALVAPVKVRSSVPRREAPLSVAAVTLFAALVLVGLGRLAGALLGAALILTVVILVRLAHVTTADPLPAEVGDFLDAPPVPRAGREALRAVLGLAGTLLGAHLLVANAATAAQRLGVPQTVVGFTLVAVGTSLPELFNAVAGGAVVGLMGRGEPARLGYPVLAAMVAVSLLTWLVLYRGYRVSRFEAVLLLVAYALTLPLIT